MAQIGTKGTAGGTGQIKKVISDNILAGKTVVLKEGSAAGGGEDLIYRLKSGSGIWKKTMLGTDIGVEILSSDAGNISYSPDGNDIIYANAGYIMYKKSAHDTLAGSAITSGPVGSMAYSPDGNDIIYASYIDGAIMYKKSAHDNDDGSAITSGTVGNMAYSPDGQYIVYTNMNDGNKLYKKSAHDTLAGSAITSLGVINMAYSPDGNFIIYSDATGIMWEKNANDTSNGSRMYIVERLESSDGNNISYTPDSLNIIYLLDDNTIRIRPRGDDMQDGSILTSNANGFSLEPIQAGSPDAFIKGDASDAEKTNFIGIAAEDGLFGSEIAIDLVLNDKQSGLTIGDKYLSDTPGEISDTPGTNEVLIGKTVSETELLLNVGGF